MNTGKKTSKNFELLGKAINEPPSSPSEAHLDTFPNRSTAGNYVVEFSCSDFTSLCPVTQQSDFANILIKYIPDELCIETKSLKFYLQSFRNQKMFNEDIVNLILSDLVKACNPKWLQVKGFFSPRGGIGVTTIAEYPYLETKELSLRNR